jgi:hypothetical protein
MAKTKFEITEGLTLWSDETHNVSTLEVQAVKIWAQWFAATMQATAAPTKAIGEEMGLLAGLLAGAGRESDDKIADMLLMSKAAEAKAGRTPISMDVVRH